MRELQLEALLDRYEEIHQDAQRREGILNMWAAGLPIAGTIAIQLIFREPLFTASIGATSLLLIGGLRVMHLRSLNSAFDQITTPLIVKVVMAEMRNRPDDTNPPDGEGLGSQPPGGSPLPPDARAPVSSPIIPPPGRLGAETAERIPVSV